MKCRNCLSEVELSFLDLGSSPPSNSYLTIEQLQGPEKYYPLRVKVCENCWLVQTEDFARREEFFTPEYAYFSSFSKTWLEHSKKYVEEMIKRFELNELSHVIEVASNDGYLLQFVKENAIPCLGIEPSKSTADVSSEKGIPTLCEFFGSRLGVDLARKGKKADLMIANNVLAHVPDTNDFLTGFFALLKDNGVATFEFPHLMRLVEKRQFDTVYHEHYSYLSLISIQDIFKRNGLEVFDVEEISTHGGSVRIFAQKENIGNHKVSQRLLELIEKEKNLGISSKKYYEGFQNHVEKLKDDLLLFLLDAKRKGKKVAAYGAAAKGNTFINFSGIRSDLINFVVDKNPNKQQKYMPGSRIPIVEESMILEIRPDYLIILPWNLRDEISEQLNYTKDWGCHFVVAIPELEVFKAK